MPNAYCLLNHKLTLRQESELRTLFGIENILYPQTFVSELWAQIPTDRELNKENLEPFTNWLQDTKTGDILVLQGEFGATFALADYSLKKGLIPVCAVTERVAQEEREGEIIHRNYIFEHKCFRRYNYFEDLI